MTPMPALWRAISAATCRAIRRVIVKNMPGAGGLALANHLYNRAPKDGTEIATVQNGLPFEKLFYMLSPEATTRSSTRPNSAGSAA